MDPATRHQLSAEHIATAMLETWGHRGGYELLVFLNISIEHVDPVPGAFLPLWDVKTSLEMALAEAVRGQRGTMADLRRALISDTSVHEIELILRAILAEGVRLRALETAATAALAEEQGAAVDFIRHEGYRRCDVAACCCGSWHGGHWVARHDEIRDALGDADVELNGVTVLGGVQVLAAERDRLARVLAVELGDESAAPDGWVRRANGTWALLEGQRVLARVHRNKTIGWTLSGKGLPNTPHGTALEAMEAGSLAETTCE
jgi:hypothetical protein